VTSFGHFVTLDIYQLADNPKVGVVYFQQFEPSDGTGSNAYFNGISDTLFSGLNALKAAGVEKIIVDNSGNRGGFIFAGAIALWSLWPQVRGGGRRDFRRNRSRAFAGFVPRIPGSVQG
jgi:C-terminal processing protease CtpA/Prc